MSAVDRAALDALHHRECVEGCVTGCDGHGFPPVCAECGVPWPCVTGALLAALVAAERDRDQLRQRVAELTERAELAEQTAQARDELLGEWVAKVERAAELETAAANTADSTPLANASRYAVAETPDGRVTWMHWPSLDGQRDPTPWALVQVSLGHDVARSADHWWSTADLELYGAVIVAAPGPWRTGTPPEATDAG